MKRNFLLIGLVIFLFCSCKNTDVSGVVYSKHNIPVANVDVKIYWTIGSDTQPEGTHTTTDSEGRYSLSFRSKRNRAYTVSCECDSGSTWEPLNERKVNKVNLYLE